MMKQNFSPAVPSKTTLNNLTIMDNICYLDLSRDFEQQDPNVSSEVIVYSIVDTLCELPEVTKVQFSVDGEQKKNMGIWKVLINRWSGIWIFWKINIYDRGDEVLKRPLCLAVCIYIAFLVGMRWVSEKDVPDLQAQNTVTILCQLDEIRGMGEKKIL